MPYKRPWKSHAEQLEVLKDRGLGCSDEAKALDYLGRLGYYRLSAYWFPFREIKLELDAASGKLKYQRLDDFIEGAQFQDAVHLYVFDKKLRLLAMDALERIEVAVRVDIAHLLGERDTFAYESPSELDTRFGTPRGGATESMHDIWLTKYGNELKRSKEEFVKHYKETHGLPLPIWVAIEIWDFGLLSTLYAGMKYKDKQAIASKYGIGDPMVFESWLRSLNYLRNICAHHSRLWNRNVVDQPKLPSVGDVPELDCFQGKADLIARPFLLFCIMRYLLAVICPNSHWHLRFAQLVEQFPSVAGNVSANDIGLIEGWRDWSMWKNDSEEK